MKGYNSQLWAFLLICSFSLFSCEKTKRYTSSNIIPVRSEIGKYSVLKLSDYVSEVDYIPLETNDNVLVSENRVQIFYENERIIVYDYILNKCLLFDKNGGFITDLGKRGQGPNEYISISEVFTDDEEIYVRESPNFLMRYDFNGKLTGKISAPNRIEGRYIINSIYPLKKTIFVLDLISSYNEKYPIALLFEANDSASLIIKEYPKYIHLKKEVLFSNSFEGAIIYRFMDEIRFYKRTINDTIFSIGQDMEMREVFIFDLGKYQMPYNLYANPVGREVMRKYITPLQIRESYDYLFLEFGFGSIAPEPYEYTYIEHRTGEPRTLQSTSVYAVFDKNTKQLTLMKQPVKEKQGFKNDIDEGPILWPKYISRNDELVTFISAEEFLQHVAEMKSPSPKLSELAKRIIPDDNPIVVIAKLKD